MTTATLTATLPTVSDTELIALVHEGCTLTDQLTPGLKRLDEIKSILKKHGNTLHSGQTSIVLKAESDEAVLTYPKLYKVNLSLRQIIKTFWYLGNIARQSLNIHVTTSEERVKALLKVKVSDPKKQQALDKLKAGIVQEFRTQGEGEKKQLAPSLEFKRK